LHCNYGKTDKHFNKMYNYQCTMIIVAESKALKRGYPSLFAHSEFKVWDFRTTTFFELAVYNIYTKSLKTQIFLLIIHSLHGIVYGAQHVRKILQIYLLKIIAARYFSWIINYDLDNLISVTKKNFNWKSKQGKKSCRNLYT
jgi:hypothetical protein